MNVLIALCGQWGHIIPTLPTACALRDRGHGVTYAFVDHAPLNQLVDDLGFRRCPLTLARSVESAVMAAGTAVVAKMTPEVAAERALATWFGPLADLMAPDLVRLADDADVVVHDNTTFAAPLAAAVAGIPSVLHGAGASSPDAVRFAASTLQPLWDRWDQGMPPLAGLMGDLYLDHFPPSIPDPAASLARVQPLRPSPPMDRRPPPPWLATLPENPVVVVTLGTNFNKDGDLWRHILSGIGGADVSVVAATGPGSHVVSQGPDVVAVEYLPLGPVLERAALVVCHAGAGTTLAALSLGVPLLLLPQGADQFHIAECVERAGAGHRLDLDRCGEQVRTALVDPGLRRGARLIQREIAAMPDVVAAASALEHLSSLGA